MADDGSDPVPGSVESAGVFPTVDRFGFTLEALEPIDLPAYEGSALRGLLGHGLKQTVCVTRAKTCDGCLLLESCPYPAIFESPALLRPPPQRSSHLPHPFVLEVIRPSPDVSTPVDFSGSRWS